MSNLSSKLMNLPTNSNNRGFSLIELMIGVTLGLIVILAVTTLFARNNHTRVEMEKSSQQIENGRYAMQLLIDDIRLAGYYGELSPASIATPSVMPSACATSSASLTAAIWLPLQGFDNVTAAPSSCSGVLTDLKSGTDVLVIRRASTCFAGSTGCDAAAATYTYFQTSLCSTTSGQYVINSDYSSSNFNTLKKKDCTTKADLRSFYTRIYYIANNNKSGDGIPTLKVAELGSGSFSITGLVAGIEQLQIEYGIDIDGDGAPDAYYPDPGQYSGCTDTTSPSCETYWRDVTAIKINLLARNTQVTSGFTDANTRTYVLGKKLQGGVLVDNSFGPYTDGYKRHVYTTSALLSNVAGRLQ